MLQPHLQLGGVLTHPTATVATEFPKAQKLILYITTSLAQLEKTFNTNSERLQLEQSVTVSVNQLARDVSALNQLLLREPTGRKEVWRRRVEQVETEAMSLRDALDRLYNEEHSRLKQVEERTAVFGNARDRLMGGARERRVARLDSSLQEQDSLHRSLRGMNDMNEVGGSVLRQLRDQRVTLRSAHGKVMELSNIAGLSRSLMGLIEGRERGDLWLIGGCSLLTVGVIVLMWWLFRS